MKAPDHAGLYFAQLSDPHLTSLQRVRWRQLLNKRVLGYLSWHHKRRAEHRGEVLDALLRDLTQTQPEHIVITGDLTHIGLPDEFRQARLWLDRLGATDRVTVVPGNHDAYVRSPWSSTFSFWQPYMQSDPEFVETPDTGSEQLFPSLRIRNGVALIGLSSASASAPFLATGSLGSQQRQRLSTLLRQAAEQGLFRIVLLHHPPREEDEKWRKRLTDGKALCAILEREGAELVLHGHSHRTVEAGIPHGQGKIPVFGIPSASAIGRQAGRRAQYYLYKVRREDDHWSVRVSVRGYQPDQDRFSLQHEHHLSMPVISSTSF
ncbi:MAG: metallophosphoesterase [Pseudomonadota bacterium]|nr:metallophosphoesterase [Pseudomonadota bacterium]